MNTTAAHASGKTPVEILYRYTKDGLRLPAFYWPHEINSHKSTCIIYTHGMLGIITEDYVAESLSKACVVNGYGFLYAHNRGYGAITEIGTNSADKNGSILTRTYGTAYDVFDECVYDIQLWINTAKELGYKNIVLMGHSMGCNKIIYYLSNHQVNGLKGVILVSPSDGASMAKYTPGYQDVLNEAKENISNGNPQKLLTSPWWGFLHISSSSFVDLFENSNYAETLPIIENPSKWNQLSCINVPILTVLGSNDNVIIKSAQDDLELIQSKATGCNDFEHLIIDGADHRYMSKGEELAANVITWMNERNSIKI